MTFARRALLIGALAAPGLARAQTAPRWAPERPIRAIVPFAPGGTTDVVARIVAETAAAQLGQPVVIENRPGGAAGLIGTDLVAKAAPDGYTILFHSNAHVIAPALVARMPFDPIGDFAGIAMLGFAPQVLVVSPRNPARTLAELVAQLRAEPGRHHFASAGIGSAVHLAGEVFRAAANLDIQPVHYRGGNPAMQGVMTGEVVFTVDPLASAIGHIRGGSVRALAIAGAERSPSLPDVPSSTEAGLPGFVAEAWVAAMAPARTPMPVLGALNAAFNAATRQSERRLAELGVVLRPGLERPDALMAFARQDMERSIGVLRAAGVRPE
ncbi:MAG TPA: tripartite tricarboxylate transporter substrate-binding protein [Acetobacteraceae bacterium]|nr:tripartite tricarboxylate transporter substrate-binding protein [Acetobacteraceae bacterium]